MHILAAIAFIPVIGMTFLMLKAFALAHIIKALLGIFAVGLGFVDWNGPQSIANNGFGGALASIGLVLWEIILAFCTTALCLLPLGMAVFFYRQEKYAYALGMLVAVSAIGLMFFPQLMGMAKQWGDLPEGADSATYVRIPYAHYSKDKEKVFWQDKVLTGADAATFEVYEEDPTYAHDKTRVYHRGAVLEVDVATFTMVGTYGYAKDKNHVWWSGVLVPDADAGTFTTVFENGVEVAKDAYHTFRATSIIE